MEANRPGSRLVDSVEVLAHVVDPTALLPAALPPPVRVINSALVNWASRVTA
ncbi:MAG: hypothetical protein HYV04_06635 [Deltaproteobacteria bacterium]|nr:hypothetical protein [Deltaproteobacteria bacterium]